MRLLTKTETWSRPKGLIASTYTPDLTADEQANVRRALQVLRRRHGSWNSLAPLLGVKLSTLEKAVVPKRTLSAGLALRAARLAKVPMEEILSGQWPKPGACPMCGRCDKTAT
jgi:hypothetical protein